MSKWQEVWVDNYHNRSDAAKDINTLMKQNYKGHNYVPWAVMLKWLYIMDENATIDVVENDKENNHIVFTDEVVIHKKHVKGDTEDTTVNYNFAHFVKLSCTFLGKTFVENYPIQDNSYNAPNYYDSNMVNKSIQRAKAKLISIATGLGYQLYENGDLQFEDDSKAKPVVKGKVIEKPKAPEKSVKITPNKEVKKEVVKTNGLDTIIKLVHSGKPYTADIIQTVNPSLLKSYNFTISIEDDEETLMEKLTNIGNVELFAKMFQKRFDNAEKENK